MSFLLGSTLKVSIVIPAGLGVAALLRHRSAAARHWVIAASMRLRAGDAGSRARRAGVGNFLLASAPSAAQRSRGPSTAPDAGG